MSRTQRLSLLLLLVLPACGDDLSAASDGSSGEDTEDSSETETTLGTTLSTTIDPSMTTTGPTSSTSMDTDVADSSSSSGDTDADTDTDSGSSSSGSSTGSDSSSTGDESSSSTTDMVECGNDIMEGREDCDGEDLADATCEMEGFVGGDIACTDDCTLDTSACTTCGDGVANGDDACDGLDLAGSTCDSLGMGFTGGTLACANDCSFDTSACTSFSVPAMGDLVLNEVMPNPAAVNDGDGEWFELHNPSLTETYDLGGCTFEGIEGEEAIVLPEGFTAAPGAYLTFAPISDVDIGFEPSHEYTENFFVTNNSDVITLDCGGVVVDAVDYTGYSYGEGFSTSLDPGSIDATLNDDPDNWCSGVDDYNAGDLGTPGVANPACPVPAIYDIDFCNVQSPFTIVEDAGTSVEIYGRLYIEGLTTVDTTGNDPAPEVSAQVGYGPDGTDPAMDEGWTWFDSVPNPEWMPVDSNDDEYFATITVPEPGEYDYAYRFSGDSQGSYTYCDTAAGSSDGYAVEDAGQMTSEELATGPERLVISEVYYDHPGDDADYEWIKLYNGTDSAIDLSTYALGWGGTDYTYGTLQLSGTIESGGCFLVGGPDGDADSGFAGEPVFDLAETLNPNGPQNSGTTADGIALFDITADLITPDTIPVDAIVYGLTNINNLIDETGDDNPPEVIDGGSGISIRMNADESWSVAEDPTPTICVLPAP